MIWVWRRSFTNASMTNSFAPWSSFTWITSWQEPRRKRAGKMYFTRFILKTKIIGHSRDKGTHNAESNRFGLNRVRGVFELEKDAVSVPTGIYIVNAECKILLKASPEVLFETIGSTDVESVIRSD